MRILLPFSLLLVSGMAAAQPYAIGTTSTSFFDADRSRDVTCEVHYPATTDGTDTPVAEGNFATLVIGHGFVMSVDAYEYVWRHFTPLGYIVVLPTTEAGFAPDHAEFGADLAHVVNALQAANTDDNSPFFGHVSASAALMGHSMGGGSTVLGAAAQPPVQAFCWLRQRPTRAPSPLQQPLRCPRWCSPPARIALHLSLIMRNPSTMRSPYPVKPW
jgi:predicted dienelactone hydrolase